MKRTIFALVGVGLLAGLTGCVFPHGRCGTGLFRGSCQDAPENCAACEDDDDCDDPQCQDCNGRGCERCRRSRCAPAPGPATGAITYPYYTLRGPRDFLAKNPPSIGPGPATAGMTSPYSTVRGPRDFGAATPPSTGP